MYTYIYICYIINCIHIPIICIMICYFINNIVIIVCHDYVHATAVKLWQVLANLVMEWLSLVSP